MSSTISADLDRAERIIADLKEQTSMSREVLGELRTISKDFDRKRSDLVKILSAYSEVREVQQKELEKWVIDTVKGLVDILGERLGAATQERIEHVGRHFDELIELVGELQSPKPGTLAYVIQRHNSIHSFTGEPVAAAAEPLEAGMTITAPNGKDYEVGGATDKIGEFLYLNQRDGKIYPLSSL